MLTRSRTFTDFQIQTEEALIDLTDGNIVLQFADCIRNLPVERRRSVWSQNVHVSNVVDFQTKTPKQMNDILLFLIIIYCKEQYSDDDHQLIAKLRVFITTSPFLRLNKYIQQTYFPLYQDEFMNNPSYFAAMIEDYGERILRSRYNRTDSGTPSTKSSSSQKMDHLAYTRLEDKMMDLFASKFGEMQHKINNLERELCAIKNTLNTEQNKDEHSLNVNTDDILHEIYNIKEAMQLFTAPQSVNISANKHNTNTKRDKLVTKAKKFKKPKIRRSASSKVMLKLSNAHKLKNRAKKNSQKKLKKMKSKQKARSGEIERRKDLFERWLATECGLDEYYNLFTENGINNLSIIQHVTMTDLALLGIQNNSHKVRIMQNIQKLKYEQSSQELQEF